MTMTEVKNKIIEVGNKIATTDLAKDEKGFKIALKRQWQKGYLTALNDVLNWIEQKG